MNRTFVRSALSIAICGVAATAVSLVVSRPIYDEQLDIALVQNIAVAAPGTALTFARYEVDGVLRSLLVTEYRQGRVSGIDLGMRLRSEADPIELYRQHGYEALSALAAENLVPVVVDAESLHLPFEPQARNIGVGLAYADHARESGLGGQPVLFPKFTQPTGARSAISKGDANLLDYEAELCFVVLDDVKAATAADARIGLLLGNDVSDRWALIKGVNPSAPMRTTGFAEGKGREGYAPIGPLLVIPRDLASFYPDIELQLYLNGKLRQRARAGEMLWTPQKTVSEIFRNARTAYRYGGASLPLLQAPENLPARTIIFSGTPAGVIFRPLNLWNPWVYLQAGDDIVIRSDYLGVIHNRISR